MYKEPVATPPLDQGDVIEEIFFPGPKQSFKGIVVTPVCDIVQNKADYITLCPFVPAFDLLDVFLEDVWEEKLGIKKGAPISGGKRKDLLSKLQPIFNGQAVRYFWLGPFPGETEPNLIDFQIIASIPIDDLSQKKRLYGLESPWREAVPTRFATYAGRVGLPDEPSGDLEKQIGGWLSTRFPSGK